MIIFLVAISLSVMEFKLGFGKMSGVGISPYGRNTACFFYIVRHKQVLVAGVLATVPLHIQLRRALTGNKSTAWLNLVERLMEFSLPTKPDFFKWKQTKTGLFSVKSLYADIEKYLWSLKYY